MDSTLIRRIHWLPFYGLIRSLQIGIKGKLVYNKKKK